MVRRIHLRPRLLAALIVGSALAPPATSAQTVLLRVVGSDTSQPVFGALAHLEDEEGRPVRSVLTDERGRALFVGVSPARYRVRVEMIGMATGVTDAFAVAAGATDAGELRLAPRPIDLEGIDVNAERRRCVARPADEGLLVANLWEEARKALSAAALTDRQGLYRYETLVYERDLDPELRVVTRQEESRRDEYMRAPFESLTPEDFAQGGFVRPDGQELVYYAPDAEVLLSDPFLDAHCFRVVEGETESGVIGLSFEPVGRRGRNVDISGTLWLDAETAELRYLEYVYANLTLAVAAPTAGGRVEFQRMPAGTWIIPEWWIEMPIIGNRVVDRGLSRPVLRALRRSGGRVLEVHEGGGRSLGGRRQTGGIEGVVVDSAGAPLVGARVGVVGASQEVFTDSEGRFGILGLMEGTYQVRFVDPRLGATGLGAPSVTRGVIPGEVSYLEFQMPSVADQLGGLCGGEAPLEGTAVLTGRVTDAAGSPWSGARVRVLWGSVTLGLDGTRGFRQRSGLEAITAADGTYSVCGLPRGQPLAISTVVDGREVAAEPATIGGSDFGRVHEIRRPR